MRCPVEPGAGCLAGRMEESSGGSRRGRRRAEEHLVSAEMGRCVGTSGRRLNHARDCSQKPRSFVSRTRMAEP